ncbi:membrane protein ORF150C [Cyprinid herpesvirus 1]|uniref:Membrane protein ORF150C n=1 Tax=Cyprinid herpesvirus 1 TaxID=317858 RepID=K7PCM0_9VIRU|nr:membrane protein ORF150C [Cyprinid herpesvirus 1]AFJ20440.1 membrane protein ORF150C [Cyprinid herpesvirus 1]
MNFYPVVVVLWHLAFSAADVTIAAVGTPVRLYCEIDLGSVDGREIVWLFSETLEGFTETTDPIARIRPVDPVFSHWGVGVHLMFELRREDEGHYKCYVESSPEISYINRVQVVDPPTKDSAYEEGSYHLSSCWMLIVMLMMFVTCARLSVFCFNHCNRNQRTDFFLCGRVVVRC